jgi:uncharacterized protein
VPAWLQAIAGGVELALLVTPRASKTRVLGPHGDALKIALAAPPVDGAANAALLDFLAKQLGVPKRQLELVSGDASRRKRVRVSGVDAASVEAVMYAGA